MSPEHARPLFPGHVLLVPREHVVTIMDAPRALLGPLAERTQDVSRGVLWLSLSFATQTSNLHGEWRLGEDPGDVRPSWDGWLKGRANAERHTWNEFGAGLVRPAVSTAGRRLSSPL